MRSKQLTDAQIYTLRRLRNTEYLLSADMKRGDEDRSTSYETRRVNAPSLPVLFREGYVEFADQKCVKEKGRWYRVKLTARGIAAAAKLRTTDERPKETK